MTEDLLIQSAYANPGWTPRKSGFKIKKARFKRNPNQRRYALHSTREIDTIALIQAK